jgi:hypothetical protein
MAKSARYTIAPRQAGVDAMAALLNGGSLEIRTLAQPADPANADTGVVLSTHGPLGSPAFGASNSSGIATANAVPSATASGSGTPGHYTAKTSGGAVVCQGSVGTSDANMILAAASIASGGTVNISSWTIGPIPMESTA